MSDPTARDELVALLDAQFVRSHVLGVGTVSGMLRSESAAYLADLLIAAGWTKGQS